ncbi:uncharacterized protein BP5553_05194 [Venustampulla echinocandica]|uniref:Uncharacterized protein n=1 Tax=Venustampulla echinocandica TaxID=2656787 RepID=A0A370TQF2_9HELO|nr:uncharacterized protein BP5553_05194 [Venustampulla echinocandica]RDL37761.1 hypothetical protein BP5553_05194 [Venustampulla echinocandica]
MGLRIFISPPDERPSESQPSSPTPPLHPASCSCPLCRARLGSMSSGNAGSPSSETQVGSSSQAAPFTAFLPPHSRNPTITRPDVDNSPARNNEDVRAAQLQVENAEEKVWEAEAETDEAKSSLREAEQDARAARLQVEIAEEEVREAEAQAEDAKDSLGEAEYKWLLAKNYQPGRLALSTDLFKTAPMSCGLRVSSRTDHRK